MIKLNIRRFAILLLVVSMLQTNMIFGQNSDSKEFLELTFSQNRNFYSEPFLLLLKTSTEPATVVYTLDCSTPNEHNGTIYTKGISIDSTCVVKAKAYAGQDSSQVVTHTFIFTSSLAKQGKKPVGFPQIWGGSTIIPGDYEMDPNIMNDPAYFADIPKAMQSIPSVSLTMDIDDWFDPNTGIYVGYPNSDVSREKAVTTEFLFDNSNENFSVECGVQNQGGTSIVNWKVPKQSMRLLFKEMYGPTKLKYKLFPDSDIKSINTLVLDGLLYSWVHSFDEKQRITSLYFRDQLASDMQNKMGWPSFHGIYVNLFINGLYWGIYDLHERPDEDFLAEYLDADKEEFDIIKHNSKTIVAGSNAAYLEMLELARKGLSTPESFKNIQKYLDLPAFIDYMLLNFYLGNYDWAHQNYYAARNNVQNSGFRFYTWDAEHVMRYSDVNYNNLQKNDKGGPTEIHSLLSMNKEYQLMFTDAVYRHFFNDGFLTPESFEESFLFRKNEIESAVILESARWGDYRKDISAGVTYTKNDHWIPEVNKVLGEYIPRRRDIVLSQLRATWPKLFPTYMPPVFADEIQSSSSTKKIKLLNPNTTEGEIYYTTDGSDPRAVGGAIHGIKYLQPTAITASSLVKTRFLPKGSTEWTALAQKSFVFDEIYGKEIVINEIMYHPENGFPEFVELYNTSETIVNLDGFAFTKGIDFTFRLGNNITAGAGLVLTNDTALFKTTYGFKAFGQFSKRLNNKCETLILENRFKQIVDSVSFSDTIPWPVAADGEGFSLEVIDPKNNNSVFANWKISENKKGTPFEPQTPKEFDVILYPNPFNDVIYTELGNQDLVYEKFIVDIFNLMGSKVKTLETLSDNLRIQIPTQDLRQGVYVIQIRTKQKTTFVGRTFRALKIK